MGKKGKRQNNKKGKGQNTSENDSENIEGKCSHVQECVKFTNLNNTVPHADLSKCQDCLTLTEKPTEVSCGSSEDSNNRPESTQEKPGICVCLRCGNIACSRQSNHQHAVQHYNSKPSHSLAVNLSNWVIWCYKCDDEVDVKTTPALGQCLALLKKALGVKKTNQEKRTETEQKKSSNIYSLSSKVSAVTGLANLGNTCFFNSVMQNLCRSQLLRVAVNHLMASDFQFCVLPSEDKTELAPLSVTINDKPGPLTTALARFLQDMKSEGKKHVVNPGYLFTEICKKAPRFKGFRQQDSQELLRYLLDSVRTEEIKGVKRALLRSFGVKNSANKEGINADQVDEDVHEKLRVYGRNARAPVIDTLFGGQLVSSVECRECHKVSTIMESFFDLSLSLAINNQTASKQVNKMPATKKKQPPTQIIQRKAPAEKVEKPTQEKPKKQEPVTDQKTNASHSSKEAEKTRKETPKPASKHQQKKMKKEAKKNKKKNRKRLSSTSSSGRKQSEVEEDHTDEDEKNETPTNDDLLGDDDVIENSIDDVTGATVDDVTGTSVGDVTETSVEEDVANVKENELMNLVKVGDKIESESSVPDIDSKEIRDCDVSATSQHDVIDTSQDGNVATSGNDDVETTMCNNGKDVNRILNSNEETKNILESSSEDNTMKDGKNLDVVSEEPLANGGDLSEGSISSENINGISKNENLGKAVENNDMFSENQTRESEVNSCCGGAMDGHDCRTESLLQSNGEDVLNCNDKEQHVFPKNNEISSENFLEDLETSLRSYNLSNDSDNVENKAGLPVDNAGECISPNCETSHMNDVCDDFMGSKSTGLPQGGDAGGINSGESNQIHHSEISESEIVHTLQDKLSNLSLESKEHSNESLHENPAFVTKIESDYCEKLKQDKLSNLSTDNDRDGSKGSHKDPVSFSKTIDCESRAREKIGNEFKDFIGNKSTISTQSDDSKNSEENKSVLDYVNQIVADILESCFHKISASSLEEANRTSFAKVESGMSFECENVKDEYNSLATFSLKENDFNEMMCEGELKSSVNGSAVSLSCSQTDEEKDEEYANENGYEELLQSEANNLLSQDVQPEAQSCVIDTQTKTEHEQIQDYAKKLVDYALKQCIDRVRTTEKQDSRSTENGSENLETFPGTDNTEKVLESEILCGNHSLGSMEAIKSNVMSVESCLKRFCSPEILEGDNMFICEQCNQSNAEEETNDEDENEYSDDKDTTNETKTKRKPIYTEAVKQLLINKAPPIFTLHLKRFHQVGYSLKKIPKHVDFPLLLDIAPFCHKTTKLATDSEGKVLYSLTGIVEHSGSMHSGHYTAYCRVPAVPSSLFDSKKFENLTQLLEVMDQMWIQGGKRESYVHEGLSTSRWFYISDSHVSEVGLERVLKAQAYLLFYERMVLSHGGENTEVNNVTE